MSFFEIFQPGLRHLREERDRLKLRVVKPAAGGGAPLGIDLDGGTAVIPAGRQSSEPTEVADHERDAEDPAPAQNPPHPEHAAPPEHATSLESRTPPEEPTPPGAR